MVSNENVFGGDICVDVGFVLIGGDEVDDEEEDEDDYIEDYDCEMSLFIVEFRIMGLDERRLFIVNEEDEFRVLFFVCYFIIFFNFIFI